MTFLCRILWCWLAFWFEQKKNDAGGHSCLSIILRWWEATDTIQTCFQKVFGVISTATSIEICSLQKEKFNFYDLIISEHQKFNFGWIRFVIAFLVLVSKHEIDLEAWLRKKPTLISCLGFCEMRAESWESIFERSKAK